MHAWANAALLTGLALGVGACMRGEDLPPPQALHAELRGVPQQVPVAAAPFEVEVDRIRYRVRPLHRYEIVGLVVSRHDSEGFLDYIHAEWGDRLNVVDLCLVYGANAASGVYRELSFSSGQFVCYVEGRGEAWRRFDPTALSNNHVLTDQPRLARRLRGLRVGDQVRLRGQLVEYGHTTDGRAFFRGTSVTRDDTGNGACETLWVEQLEVLARGGGSQRLLAWAGGLLVAAGIAGWLVLPMRVRG